MILGRVTIDGIRDDSKGWVKPARWRLVTAADALRAWDGPLRCPHRVLPDMPVVGAQPRERSIHSTRNIAAYCSLLRLVGSGKK